VHKKHPEFGGLTSLGKRENNETKNIKNNSGTDGSVVRLKRLAMSLDCVFSQGKETRRICGLLGDEEFSDAQVAGRIAALQELVEHFAIEWELTPRLIGEREEDWESGFTLRLKGAHEHDSHSAGQTSAHHTNLMLALRIVGEWVLPPEGNCAFCCAEAYTKFVQGDRNNQGEACSTRTLRVATQKGSRCHAEACYRWCMKKIRERLAVVGAVERKETAESAAEGGL
jgi:hypothetical protein